jgi:hypothetical protein
MGLLSRLLKGGDPPVSDWTDAALGRLVWSDDEEGWVGAHQGLSIVLSRGAEPQPEESVVRYARERLSDPGWMAATLEKAKREAIAEYGLQLGPEIERLQFELINFYARKGHLRIIADLSGGERDRAWRIEYGGLTCEGIGFDT